MDVLQYFHDRADLTDEQVKKVASLFKTKKYAKKEQIIPMYSHSNKLYFIAEGIIRIYYLKSDKDITHMFFTEGQITVPVENVFYNKPSPYAMEALEDCTIQIADYRELEKVLFEIPALQKLAQSIYVENVQQQAQVDTEKAYRKLKQAEQLIAVAEKVVEYRRQELKIEQDKFNAGLNTQIKVVEVEAALANAEADLYGAKMNYKVAEAELQFITESK